MRVHLGATGQARTRGAAGSDGGVARESLLCARSTLLARLEEPGLCLLALDAFQNLCVVAVVIFVGASLEGLVGTDVPSVLCHTACFAGTTLLTALQLLDSLLPLPLLAELVDELLTVDGAVGHRLDLVEMVGFAEHVEQLLNVELEVVNAVVVVLPHAAHLVLQALRRSSRSSESLLEVCDLRLETADKTLVTGGDLILEIGLLALHTREFGTNLTSLRLGVLQLLLVEEAAEDVRD